jgi:hypothetical protein
MTASAFCARALIGFMLFGACRAFADEKSIVLNRGSVVVEVIALQAGLDAEAMAASVAAPLERKFSDVPHLVSMTSAASNAGTTIRLHFDNMAADDCVRATQAALDAALERRLGQKPSVTVGLGAPSKP